MRTPAVSPLAREIVDAGGADAVSARGVPDAPAAKRAGTFPDALGRALGDVEALQVAADEDARQVALGGGNLHETALALEKADIGLRVAVKVRNRLVEAYQEIMRMPV